MLEKIRNKYLYNKTQVIEIDKKGFIIQTDNLLFALPNNSSVANFHPFFETILSLIEKNEVEYMFYCIHIEYKNNIKTVDVLFNSGSLQTNPFIILYDFTKHYNNFQNIAQEKNETVLNFHLEELKTRQLQSEKDFKNKFLANIGHDLKTPINATNWFIKMLQKSNLNEQQQEILELLDESNQIVKTLINDILDLSRIELGKIEIVYKKVNLHKLLNHLDQIYTQNATTKKLEFKLLIASDIPKFIIADSVRLEQILINLLDNSLKFTKKGSFELNVTLEHIHKDIKNIVFSVKDTGIGFKTNQKIDVYQSFKKLHKTNIDGLGLGLSIVSNLVELMNGSINYDSKLGEGTTFYVRIPLDKTL